MVYNRAIANFAETAAKKVEDANDQRDKRRTDI